MGIAPLPEIFPIITPKQPVCKTKPVPGDSAASFKYAQLWYFLCLVLLFPVFQTVRKGQKPLAGFPARGFVRYAILAEISYKFQYFLPRTVTVVMPRAAATIRPIHRPIWLLSPVGGVVTLGISTGSLA